MTKLSDITRALRLEDGDTRGETTQVKLYLTPACHDKLASASSRTGISMSRLAEAAVLAFVDDEPAPDDRQAEMPLGDPGDCVLRDPDPDFDPFTE